MSEYYNPNRCGWPGNDPAMIKYHDSEWGVPCYDDKKLFEYIVLDTFQAGLSWQIVLHKRQGFGKAFAGFDYNQVALFTPHNAERLMADTSIIRNRLKILATINNAQRFLEIQQEFGSFSKYIWGFVGGQPTINSPNQDSSIASTSAESDAMSVDLKKRGFKFVGSTICYAFMQGAGLVNDHLTTCPARDA